MLILDQLILCALPAAFQTESKYSTSIDIIICLNISLFQHYQYQEGHLAWVEARHLFQRKYSSDVTLVLVCVGRAGTLKIFSNKNKCKGENYHNFYV